MPANPAINRARPSRSTSASSSRAKTAQKEKVLRPVTNDDDKLYDPEWDTASDEDDLNTYMDIAQKDD